MANEFKIKNGLVVSGSADVEQNLTVNGILTAKQYNVSLISSSILFESGSTQFGNSSDDTHLFTGSIKVTGSISLNGQAIGTGKLDETTFQNYTSSTDGRLNLLENSTGSIRNDFNSFTSSYTNVSSSLDSRLDTLETLSGSFTGSFSGSFVGNGANLYNIPASGVTGLNLTQIADGSVTASVSNTNGFKVNSKTEITGSLIVTNGITGSIDYSNITNKPTLVSGSSQISVTGTTDYSTFSSSISSSIGSLSSSIATTDSNQNIKIGLIETSTGSLNSFTSSALTRVSAIETSTSSLNSFTSSAQTKVNLIEISTASLNLFTSSALIRVGAIETSTSSLNSFTSSALTRVSAIETSTSSLNSFTSSIDTTIKNKLNTDGVISGSVQVNITGTTGYSTFSSSISSSIGSLSSSVATTTNNLSSSIGSLSSSIATTDLNQSNKIGNLEISTGSLNSFTSSALTRVTAIETSTSSLNTFTSSLSGAVEVTGSNLTVKGNLLVKGTTTTINSTTLTIDDNIIQLNGTGATNAGLVVRDATAPNTLSGSLLWDTTNDRWVAGVLGSEDRIILATEFTALSSSILSRATSLESASSSIRTDFNSFTSSNNSIESTQNSRLTSIEGVTGSIGSLNTYTGSNNTVIGTLQTATSSINTFTASALTRVAAIETSTSSLNTFTSSIATTIKNKLNTENVVSGSSQVLNGTTIHSGSFFNGISVVSGSSQVSYNGITNIPSGIVSGSSQVLLSSGVWSGSAQLPSGIVSGSSQLPSGLVSGSSQVLNGTTIHSGSFFNGISVVSGSGQIAFGGVTGVPSGLVSGSSQVDITSTTNYTSFSSSIATTDLSQNNRLSSIESKTGSYATTGSNVFKDNQTISGSLIITQNLTVFGSSSITYVTSSQLRIDDNIITVNTSSPGSRFGGIEVYDSGSIIQATGSMLWDSINNRWIYQQSSEATYGGGVLMSGPRSSGSLGSELTLTNGKIARSAGGDHLNDSIITEYSGTTIGVSGSLDITGSINVGGGGKLTVAAIGGDEGGEILLGKAITNTTLAGEGVTIDIWQNRLRIFEQGGNARGAYLDISTLANGVGTNLVGNAATASYVEYSNVANKPTLVSGSGQIDITNTTNYTSFSSSIATTDGNQNTRLGLLETSTGSLNSFTSSALTRVTAIETSTSSLNSFTGSIDTTIKNKMNSDGVISGSSQISLGMVNGYTTFSSSIATTDFTQDGRLTSIEGKTGSISLLNTYTGSNNTVIGTLQTSTSSLNSFSSSVSSVTYSLQLTTASLNTYTSSNNTVIGTLQTATSSLNTYTSSNNTVIGTLQTSTSSLNSYTSSNTTNINAIHTSTGSFKSFTSSFDTAFGMSGADVTIKGNLTVSGTSTTINSTTVAIGDNIIQLNGTGATNAGLVVRDATAPNSVSGSLLWDTTNDKWIAGALGSEDDVILRTASQTLTNKTINASQLVDASVTNAKLQYSSLSIAGTSTSLGGSISAATILSGTGVWSGSVQLPSGVVSGSAQIIAGLPSGTISGSAQLPSGTVSGSAQIIAGLPSGTISGSAQLPSGIVSGSAQIIAGLPSGTVSGSIQVSLSGTNGFGTYINQAVLTSSSPTFNYVYGNSIQISGNGGTNDPYGTVSVSQPITSNYSYYGLTRNGNIGMGMGINISNQFFIGATTSGAVGAVLSGTGWMVLSSSAATFNGAISASNFSGTHSGTSSGTNTGDQTSVSGNAGTVTNGVYTTGTYADPSWITSLAYTKITGVPAFLTSYTETSTLANVTARGATTSTETIFTGNLKTRKTQTANDYTTAALWVESYTTTATGIAFHISGTVGKFLEMRTNGTLYWDNNTVWTAGTLTNLNQLTNGPGYISSITSGNVTTALGFTPYNATNPNGYITGISFANVSSKPTTISGYGITDAITTGNIGSQSVSYATTAGTASNISAYTINQSVGTGNSPTFAAITVSGLVTASQSGFQSATYASGRNRIWSFGNADGYGLSYFQGSGGYGGSQDMIGFHFGTASVAGSKFTFVTDGRFIISGDILPSANNTYNLGSASQGWANVYTNDLHLSNMNKPEGNDIDGTKGTWTIQEGAENLYIINNNNGKKFKINLEEII